MAIYRNIHTSFWDDTKVLDEMTPEDRYFMLYILSNPHTNQVGCYEISIRQMSNETGYTTETIEKLLERFEMKLKTIKYSKETKELLILNWHKYNWTSSPKVKSCVMKELENIKNKEFKEFINTVCIPYIYTIDTHTQEEEEQNLNNQIIDYLNNKASKKFKKTSKKTRRLITARIKEKYTLNDFKKVIDVKVAQWKNDIKMQKYLRPETLFGPKFEGYLNETLQQEETQYSTDFSEYDELERRYKK